MGLHIIDRASKRVFLQASLWAFFWFFVLDAPGVDTPWKRASKEEQAAEERAAKRAKVQKPQASEDVKDGEAEGKEEEEDVDVPEEMPENAVFIPLGWAKKKPKTFYKGTDPEWQSFVDFSKDRKRTQVIRGI